MKTADIAIADNVIIPDGYSYGSHVAGSVWYLLRDSDGAVILARTGDDDGCVGQDDVAEEIERAFAAR